MHRAAAQPTPPIIAICGWKKSGKTTLSVRLIEEFTRRGFKVATLKHAHHNFQIDDGETDSARHRRAGAAQTAVISKNRWAMVSELPDHEDEPDFKDVVTWFKPCDLIIVEGYKSAPIPKIEARRSKAFTRTPLAPDDDRIIAIAADHDINSNAAASDSNPNALPCFSLDDIKAIADLIASHLHLELPTPASTSTPT